MIKKRQLYVRKWPACYALGSFFCFATFAGAQTTPSQSPSQSATQTQDPSQDSNRSAQDRNANGREMSSFWDFLNNHDQVADQLRRSPSLADNPQFLQQHPELQTYLQNHPEIAAQLKENPDGFMQQEEQFANNRDKDLTQRQINSPATKRDVASFYNFLNAHPQIADKLRADPAAADDPGYLREHPELQAYLQQNPNVRQMLVQRPDGFMLDEENYAKNPSGYQGGSQSSQSTGSQSQNRGSQSSQNTGSQSQSPNNGSQSQNNRVTTLPDDNRNSDRGDRGDLASFNRYLGSHPEIAEQIRKNPSLCDNAQFLKNHPSLQTYLQQNPGVRQQLQQNPNGFMQAEDRFDRGQAGQDQTGRDQRELASFDHFLNDHREVAEQLRKDPSLVDNSQFVKTHPALQTYLQDHPEVRTALKDNPNGFMQQEARYQNSENGMNGQNGAYRDRNSMNNHSASFGEFLGAHAGISEQLSKDPSLVKRQDYMQDHPELQSYLNDHPEVRQDLMANPQTFVQSAQQFNSNGQAGKTTTTPATPSTTAEPNKPPKQ
jgi:hypothetical protein